MQENKYQIPAPTPSEIEYAKKLIAKTLNIVTPEAAANTVVSPSIKAITTSLNNTFSYFFDHDPLKYKTSFTNYFYPSQIAHNSALTSSKAPVFEGYEKLFNTTASLYGHLFKALNRVAELADSKKVNPNIEFKVSNSGTEPKHFDLERPARVVFYATKFDPIQLVHLLVIPYLIAEFQADKVIVMNDNSDPDRKPNLSSLAIREPIAKEAIKIFSPFVQYISFQKEDLSLFAADGETVLKEFMSQNKQYPLSVTYVAGVDHMKLTTINKLNQEVNDTPLKIKEFLDARDSFGFHKQTTVNLAFLHRPGIEGVATPQEIKDGSGIDVKVVDLGVVSNVSATMVREEGRFWLSLSMIQPIAAKLGIWGYGKNEEFLTEQNEVLAQLEKLLEQKPFPIKEFEEKLHRAKGLAIHKIDGMLIKKILNSPQDTTWQNAREAIFRAAAKLINTAL